VKAFVIAGPGRAGVVDVEPPAAVPGEVVIDVERAGICGTDVEIFTGDMAYLRSGSSHYPIRIGHEWCGVVRAVGEGVDPAWIGRRVTGDTMLGCGHCAVCAAERRYLCPDRQELGILGRPGALAEQLAMPVSALFELPPAVDPVAGALVEPGGNAVRAADAAGAASGTGAASAGAASGTGAAPGGRIAIWGPGTIGLLAALFAAAAGAEVHVIGVDEASLAFARTLDISGGPGLAGVWAADAVPSLSFDAAIDATNAASVPATALATVRPGGRVVYIGLAGTPSRIDTRDLVLADLTAVGLLSASPGLAAAIASYASGAVDPTPLVAATISLDAVADALAGHRRPASAGSGQGPKIHVDPRL
jgi:threonine dehydrogenase-like Zn-dependent dehydrogenase